MSDLDRKSVRLSRRSLLGLAAGTALPAWALEYLAPSPASAAPREKNDRPGILLVGCGSRGKNIAKEARKLGDVLAVCDVDGRRLPEAAESLKAEARYRDFREALEHPGVDVVLNGTPDHWHTLINIAALHAGKDVYSEKPLTLTIEEGRKLVGVVRGTGRVLQTGSQQRSDARFRLACELVRNGRIGKLRRVVTTLPAGPQHGPFQPQSAPPELDWDLWLGPAPLVEYVPERCHRSFRYWYDYSGGTMTDWGAHHNDIALWGMGMDRSGPVSIEGKLLEPPVPGGFSAASDYRVEYLYENGVSHVCESTRAVQTNGAPAEDRKPGDPTHGVRFEGSDGWIFVTRGKLEASRPELLKEPLPSSAVRLYASEDHMGDFFVCVRTRKEPACPAEVGHRSASVCHLGTLSLRLGRKLTWDPAGERFAGDDEANGWIGRPMRGPWQLPA